MIAPSSSSNKASSDEERGLPTIDIIGAPVTCLSLDEQVSVMVDWAKQRVSKVVCVANVHMLMESRTNAELRSVLGNADLVTPDGMPLVWMIKALRSVSQDRVAGMDIFEHVCKQCEQTGVSIYLIGSTEEVLGKMQLRISEDFPDLKLAGVESPPFRELSLTEHRETAERINASSAGVTFVSLGCPKQERWMAIHSGNVQSVMIGVGAVFPVYARVLQHAPQWIRKNGLEWLYRWMQEPKRLSKRYVQTIPPFIYLALKQIKTEKVARSFSLFSQLLVAHVSPALGKAKQPTPQ
ncbi:MAG: WecB/TagA/CpsF family glycosyltransferase [Cyanobacteria bacterium J06650_10]